MAFCENRVDDNPIPGTRRSMEELPSPSDPKSQDHKRDYQDHDDDVRWVFPHGHGIISPPRINVLGYLSVHGKYRYQG